MLSVALALSTTIPAGAAFAREADQEQEGTAPRERTLPDTATDPDYDPGSETILNLDIGTPRDGGDHTDDAAAGAPVDAEPVQDLDAVTVDDPTESAPDANGGSDQPVPLSEPVPPTPLSAPAPEPSPAATTPPVADQRIVDDDRAKPHGAKHTPARKAPRDRARPRPTVLVALPATAEAPTSTPAQTPPATTAVAPEPSQRAQHGRAIHTVQSGESLWTIASDLLGPDATDAEIATETDRLYRLNRDRIGDDPNLLIAGTVLRLR